MESVESERARHDDDAVIGGVDHLGHNEHTDQIWVPGPFALGFHPALNFLDQQVRWRVHSGIQQYESELVRRNLRRASRDGTLDQPPDLSASVRGEPHRAAATRIAGRPITLISTNPSISSTMGNGPPEFARRTFVGGTSAQSPSILARMHDRPSSLSWAHRVIEWAISG